MSQQSDSMRASVTRYGFWNEEEKKKEKTDKELSDNDNSDN
jgi:hypothetical protein